MPGLVQTQGPHGMTFHDDNTRVVDATAIDRSFVAGQHYNHIGTAALSATSADYNRAFASSARPSGPAMLHAQWSASTVVTRDRRYQAFLSSTLAVWAEHQGIIKWPSKPLSSWKEQRLRCTGELRRTISLDVVAKLASPVGWQLMAHGWVDHRRAHHLCLPHICGAHGIHAYCGAGKQMQVETAYRLSTVLDCGNMDIREKLVHHLPCVTLLCRCYYGGCNTSTTRTRCGATC